MKIVHLAAGDLSSGAGKGLLNLHEGLLQLGVDSHVLTTHPSENPLPNKSHLLKSPFLQHSHQAKVRLLYALNRNLSGKRVSMYASRFGGYDLREHPLIQAADVIHLHWTNNLLSVGNIGQLGRLKKPIVWTLRDLWPFTGGCHYSFECERYTEACGKCPIFGGGLLRDRTHWQHRAKLKAYAGLASLHPVAISPWISEQALRSSLLRDRNVRMIWNGVNLSQFPLLDKRAARQLLGLDPGRRYLCIGAVNLNYSYKGYDVLKAALDFFREKKACGSGEFAPALLIFGRGGEALAADFPGSKHFGLVQDNARLNQIYAACDVFLMPSIQEAFGKTIVEALASGTPVVCFDNSGPRDMVEHKVSGYKARPFDPEDFSRGIDWCLQASPANTSQCLVASKRFCHLASAQSYCQLYQSL